MNRFKGEVVPFLTEAEIQSMIEKLAREIELDFEGEEIIFICPLKGSLLFFTDLMRKVNLEQKSDFVHLTSPKGESVRIHKDISLDISGKNVIIVEEIIDAGRTLNFLKNRIISSYPKSVKIVTLLDKPARRELPIKPDYVGKTIDDRYLVGYGMDVEEYGRNYKQIFSFVQ